MLSFSKECQGTLQTGHPCARVPVILHRQDALLHFTNYTSINVEARPSTSIKTTIH